MRLPLTGSFFSRIWTWFSVFLMAEASILVVNALLALIYKKFVWGFDSFIHASTVLLAFVILFTIRYFNKMLDRELPWENNVTIRLFVQLAGNLGVTLFFSLFLRNLLLFLARSGTKNPGFVRLQDEILVSLVVSFFTLLVVLIDLGIYLMGQWKKSATEAERFKQENLEFRFDRLRNQVNPHFLFNSLNTLASLVYNDPDTASDFIRQMAKVYRYVLENRDKEVITLEEELLFLEAYLYLVKIRFEEGIRFEMDIPAGLSQHYLPPMTLQLLIENALKHNVVSASRPLTIRIKGTGNRLSIENNLQTKLTPEPSTRTGLENIKSRYAFLTAEPVEILHGSEIFSVSIPLLAKHQKTRNQ